MRVGIGWDAHRLVEGRPLILGGVSIPFDKGLAGHSDADVLLHAIIDALLGAAALGDIGGHFPDTDPAYAGISSLALLACTGDLLRREGWRVENVDAVVIAQAPKIAPFILEMRQNIAQTLRIDAGQMSVKGKTSEHMGYCGRGEGIAAQAVVLLERTAIKNAYSKGSFGITV
ncbi:MAG: 2-C-methyl-D-erythritol 2,4-cyclodiphosphate synthase [Firmicutes bacterium]|nr:2-C-methyl-D-erythritol 2,4-cyclodiphosphate synthase [Bacillota bacterium]